MTATRGLFRSACTFALLALVPSCGTRSEQQLLASTATSPAQATAEDPGLTRKAANLSRRGPVTPEEVATANLTGRLFERRRARITAERPEVMRKIRDREAEFRAPLVEIIEDDTELLVQAIQVATELRMTRAAGAIQDVAYGGKPEQRAVAIGAFHILEGWSRSSLQTLLRQTDAASLVATLEVCAQTEDRPLDLIIALLGHPQDSVRDAAAKAIPRLGNGPELDALCELASNGTPTEARAAARALGRTRLNRKAERCLSGLIGHRDWTVTRAALQALENKTGRLSDPGAVLNMLRDPEVAAEEKAAGFIALESTRTLPVAQLRALIRHQHPVCRMLAARCLVSAGDKQGVLWLIQALGTTQGPGVDDEARDCAVHEARLVLTELAGEDHGESKKRWIEWLRQARPLKPRVLRHEAPRAW